MLSYFGTKITDLQFSAAAFCFKSAGVSLVPQSKK